MKKNINTLISLMFLVVYSWTLMLFFTTNETSYIKKSVQSKQTTQYKVSTSDVLSHTIQTDGTYISLKTVSSYPAFNFLPFSHLIVVQFFNNTERAELRQYTSFFLNVLIHHRKKDILFPFQYFW